MILQHRERSDAPIHPEGPEYTTTLMGFARAVRGVTWSLWRLALPHYGDTVEANDSDMNLEASMPLHPEGEPRLKQ